MKDRGIAGSDELLRTIAKTNCSNCVCYWLRTLRHNPGPLFNFQPCADAPRAVLTWLAAC
jgi:hypothetical protein